MDTPFITAEQLRVRLCKPSMKALYHWLARNPGCPRFRPSRGRRGSLLFDPRAVDAYVRGELSVRLKRSA